MFKNEENGYRFESNGSNYRLEHQVKMSYTASALGSSL